MWIWRAWETLSPHRAIIAGGMGPAIPRPISWFDVEAYADRIGADAGERETLHQVLDRLDRMKLEHDAAAAKRQAEGATGQ